MEKEIKVIFEGQDEIIKAIDSQSEIVTLLGLPSEKCALIGSKIKLIKLLGKGAQGTVFQIEFPGMGEKIYVAKKANMTLEVYNTQQSKAEKYLDKINLTWADIRDWQSSKNVDKWENANPYDKVSIVIPPKMCLSNQRIFEAIPSNVKYNSDLPYTNDGKHIDIPKGSYICNNQSFSELAIAIYVGKLYRDNICINFFNTYSMFTCVNQKQYNSDFNEYTQYTFMDKIDGALNNYHQCIKWNKYIEENKRISPNITDGIYIQTLFAIAAYQHYNRISHNDLHLGNLFVEFVTSETTYNGEKLIDADFYHYSIGGNDIYIPAIPVLAKIGDFGLSIKYTEPIIGCLEVFEDGMNTNDGTGAWIPTVYIPQYDSLYFTGVYIIGVVKAIVYENATDMMRDCMTFMCPNINAESFKNTTPHTTILTLLTKEGYLKPSNYRPVLNKLAEVKNARETLLGPVMKYYSTKPKSGKIITIGKI
jgi:serine/threonine protein kinase